jgi:hypothetical protein
VWNARGFTLEISVPYSIEFGGRRIKGRIQQCWS